MECKKKCDDTFPAGGFIHTQCVGYCGTPSLGAQVSAPTTNAVLNVALLLVGVALIAYGIKTK